MTLNFLFLQNKFHLNSGRQFVAFIHVFLGNLPFRGMEVDMPFVGCNKLRYKYLYCGETCCIAFNGRKVDE